jgi:nitroreductase
MNEDAPDATVADYKRLLQLVCDKRPSGTRGRLALALGTNRSFVSQLVNPVYPMPVPAQHLETIFEVCHFSPTERAAFLTAYDQAHPGRRDSGEALAATRAITLTVPDLGTARRNKAFDDMMAEYAHHLVRLVAVLKD